MARDQSSNTGSPSPLPLPLPPAAAADPLITDPNTHIHTNHQSTRRGLVCETPQGQRLAPPLVRTTTPSPTIVAAVVRTLY